VKRKTKFDGKTVLVTGGAWGIGRQISLRLAARGYGVVIADIDRSRGEAAAREIRRDGGIATFLLTDLSLPGAAESLWESVRRHCGSPSYLVNNARSGRRKPLADETEADFDFAMQVTLKLAFFLSQKLLAEKASVGTAARAIVNIASVTAERVAMEESATYHIAKAGLLHMTRYFAAAGGARGVRVNAVSPGFIVKDEHLSRYLAESNATYRGIAEAAHPGGSTGRAADVADAVDFLLSERARFITGQNLVVDGGLCIQDPSAVMLRNMLHEKRD
jgi:3-oxoacyl-[acyl-carrier protein] reductase